MKKDFLKMVAVTLPILFLFFVSVSYAKTSSNQIVATVTIIGGGLNVKILRPLNTTYETETNTKNLLVEYQMIDLKFKKNVKYWAGYSLDDAPLTKFSSGTTYINNIPLGSHKVAVYVNDTLGNSGSDVVFFTIKKHICNNLLLHLLRICV